MSTQPSNLDEFARQAKDVYDRLIRPAVETEDNIGKMVTVDVDSGTYAFDDEATTSSADQLLAVNPNARLFGFRIGYNAAYALGGVLERSRP